MDTRPFGAGGRAAKSRHAHEYNTAMTTIYRLNALNGFQCLGGACEDNCCQAPWDIHVDKPARSRWTELPESSMRSALLDSTTPITRDGLSLLTFKRTDTGQCVHLGKSGLCRVHSELGADALPTVCREYPRLNHRCDDFGIESATLSCPEIARLVLSAARPTFKTEQRPSHENPIKRSLAALTETVFSQATVTLGAKLLYLGQMLVNLAQASSRNTLDVGTLQQKPRAVKTALFELNLRIKRGEFDPSAMLNVLFWRGIAAFGQARNAFDGSESETPKLIAQLRQPYSETANYFVEANAALAECWKSSSPSFEKHTNMLHRYAEVSLVNKGFPWNPVADNYIASFLYAVIPLALLELHLRTEIAGGGAITEAVIVRTTYRIERKFGHSNFLYSFLEKHPDLLRLDQYLNVLSKL